MKTRSALKEGEKKPIRIWLQSHQQLHSLVNTFWEVKDCTELLILNSSQDL